MNVSVDIRQQTSALDGPLYRVKTAIIAAQNISSALFVFKATNDAFDHYATAADIARWPDTKAEALSRALGFYRQPVVQRDWSTVDAMNGDLKVTVERIQAVVDEWAAASTTVAVDRILTLSSGT